MNQAFSGKIRRGISLWQCVYSVACELVVVEFVRLGRDGRITIPVRLRKSLGLKKGAEFVIECSERDSVLRLVLSKHARTEG